MPAQNYSFNIPSPTQRLLGGIQQGLGIGNVLEQREQRDIQFEQQQEDRRSAAVQKEWNLLTKEQQTNNLRFSGKVIAALGTSSKFGVDLLKERAEAERNSGNEQGAAEYDRWAEIAEIDPEGVRGAMTTLLATLPGGAKIVDSIGKARGFGRGAGAKAFAPVTLVNPSTGEKIPHIPTFDPSTGKARLEPADLPEGFELSKETKAEERQAEIATVGAKEGAKITGKGQAARRQVTINQGVESSGGLANLRRAKVLLEGVKTGGINAASLRAKQLFGVEGADEGELSNRLGKAVLSQLKATFGAAFTAQEGASLERIEAGFKKSPEANKRLINQLIKMVENKAQQGINSAIKAQDFEAAQLIKENMAFTLDDETLPAPQGQRLKFNPKTGLIE